MYHHLGNSIWLFNKSLVLGVLRPHFPASPLLDCWGNKCYKKLTWYAWWVQTLNLLTSYPHKLAQYSKPNVFSSTSAIKRRNLEYTILPHDIKSLYTEDSLEAHVPHLVWWTKENTTLDTNTNKNPSQNSNKKKIKLRNLVLIF